MGPTSGVVALATLLAQDPVQDPPKDLTRASELSPRWALVIGVDQYDDPDIADLRFSDDDAKAMARTLLASGAYTADHVILMTSDQANPQLRPTRSNILEQLSALQVLQDVDTLFFYYSGHGAASEADRSNYVFPQDTSLSLPMQTGIVLSDLLAGLDQVDAKRRFIVLDACRNRLVANARANPTAWYDQQYAVAGGTQILYGTAPGSFAYEDEEAALGTMTRFLVSGLVGAADGADQSAPDGVISSNELYTWLDMQMRERSASSGRAQVPGRGGDWWGSDFALLPIPIGEVVVKVSCPTRRADLQRALERAATKPSASRVESAHSAFACLDQALNPTLAARYHALEGGAAAASRDTSAALLSYRAVHEIAPAWTPTLADPVSAQIWNQALTETASPRAQVLVPEDARLLVDGREDDTVPTERPAILQATRGRDVQWTRIYTPEDGLPTIILPALTRVERAERGLRRASLWTGAASALLWTGALIERNTYLHAKERVLETDQLNRYGGSAQRAYDLTLLLGYAAQGTTALSLGMGGVSFVLSR